MNYDKLFNDIYNKSNNKYYWFGWYYNGQFLKGIKGRQCHYLIILDNPKFFGIEPKDIDDFLKKYGYPELNHSKPVSFDWEKKSKFTEYTKAWAELMDMVYSKGAIRIITDIGDDDTLDITIKDIKHHKDYLLDFLMNNAQFLKLKEVKHFNIDDFLDDVATSNIDDKEQRDELRGKNSFCTDDLDELIEWLC